MAQRFKMPDALNGVGDRFLIYNVALPERDVKAKALRDQAAQHLELDLAHQLHQDIAVALVPYYVELRILSFEYPHFGKRGVRADLRRQRHAIGQHRLQHRQAAVGFGAQAVAAARKGDARDGADGACRRLADGGEFFARINADLVDLFAACVARAREHVLDTQHAAGHLEKGEAVPLVVLGDLVDLGAELAAIGRHTRQPLHCLPKPFNALEL